MNKNMGKTDKSIRIIVALVISALYFTHIIQGTIGIILLILGAVFLVTSFLGFCPLYKPFKIKTTSK